ncbi:MAG: hypothetical protein QOG23_4855 [Blastocatellia bacterium]|jgi:hypothetical protein|nr:hypothetical protein [Blastocatellia bacterium]
MENQKKLEDQELELKVAQHQLTKKFIEKQLKGDPIKEYMIPLGSLLVALLGVLSGVYAQYIGAQATLRVAAITTRQTGYSKVLTALDTAQDAKQRGTLQSKHLDDLRQAYYDVELFVPQARREAILGNVEELIKLMSAESPAKPENIQQYINARRALRQSLQEVLS